MTPREQVALAALVAAGQPVAAMAVAKQMRIRKDSVLRYLSNLEELGMVRKIGTGAHIRWAARGVVEPTHHHLLPYEQAPSVWAYADRCAA